VPLFMPAVAVVLGGLILILALIFVILHRHTCCVCDHRNGKADKERSPADDSAKVSTHTDRHDGMSPVTLDFMDDAAYIKGDGESYQTVFVDGIPPEGTFVPRETPGKYASKYVAREAQLDDEGEEAQVECGFGNVYCCAAPVQHRRSSEDSPLRKLPPPHVRRDTHSTISCPSPRPVGRSREEPRSPDSAASGQRGGPWCAEGSGPGNWIPSCAPTIRIASRAEATELDGDLIRP